MLRDLWAASLIVRCLAVVIGWSKAPRYWLLWAALYFASGVALRIADIENAGFSYTVLWELQQIFSLGLLVFVVREAVKPTWLACYVSICVALAVGAAVAQTYHWPGSQVEAVMWAGGVAALALGLISMVSRKACAFILAGFLLLYAGLMLAGADYLTKPNLGIAWSVLEVAAFGSWAVLFALGNRRKS